MIGVMSLVYAGVLLAVAEVVVSVRQYRSPQARMDRALKLWEVSCG